MRDIQSLPIAFPARDFKLGVDIESLIPQETIIPFNLPSLTEKTIYYIHALRDRIVKTTKDLDTKKRLISALITGSPS